MSDQDQDYAAIRRKVEKGVSRQKWVYRTTFFVVHLIFYVLTMLVVWGTVTSNPQLRELLFNNGSSAASIVILPTILWGAVVLFHVASLFYESGAGEKAIRERLLMGEVREEMLRKGLIDEGVTQKPKRHATSLEPERTMLSYDGELVSVYEDEPSAQSDYNARANHAAKP
jgi:hypothetical protein